MSEYTPGPWSIIHVTGCSYNHFDIRHEGSNVTTVYTSRPQVEAQANAKLIAAAPDLLEAVEEMLSSAEWSTYGNCSPESILKARAAVAKARDVS